MTTLINQTELNRLLGADGPVARQVQEVADDVLDAVEQTIPRDTGQTARSFETRMEQGPDGPVAHVFSDDPVAGYLEHGTRHMRARPYMRRALQAGSPWPVD